MKKIELLSMHLNIGKTKENSSIETILSLELRTLARDKEINHGIFPAIRHQLHLLEQWMQDHE